MVNSRFFAVPALLLPHAAPRHAIADLSGTRRPGARMRSIAVLATAALLAAGCRGDSFTSPNVDCSGQAGCRTPPGAPAAAEVFVSLNDAETRLVPTLGQPAAQHSIIAAIDALSRALQENRYADARASLAQVYELIAPFRTTQSDGTGVDTPDVAAIRLDLVPAANTLGVQAR